VAAKEGYAGPGAIVIEVTTGTGVDDPDGIKATLSVPVQVGETRPILRCPDDPIEVSQAESARIDVAAVCHVWTAEEDQLDGLTWSADFDAGSAPGLTASTPEAGVVQVTASAGTEPGDTGSLRVAADDSDPGRIRIRVIRTPPPSLAPIRVATLRAGESQTIDLARYLTPGVSDPVPTVVSAEQVTNLDVRISSSGSSVTITTGSKVHGHAEFRVVMSDVAGDAAADRRVQGRIAVDVLGPPSVPGTPVHGDVLDSAVDLDWRAPESNGSPVDFYEVQDQSGHSYRCRSSSCTIKGLENGTTYKFHVRAHNAVGFSPWSGYSRAYMPDDPLEIVGKIKLLKAGDGFLHIDWNPVESKGGSEITYFIKWQGDQATSNTSDLVVSGLDNHKTYTFTIQPRNGFIPGGFLTSAPFQPIGPAGQPRAPTVTDQETAGSTGAVTLSWDPVDPNGPGGVRYTVFKDGTALRTCTKITQTGCDVSSLAYNGHTYVFTVQAVNKDGKTGGQPSAMSPPTSWKAVGKPASWGDWSVDPTGNNNQAKASFTVPPSRGEQSRVSVYADGAKVQQTEVAGETSMVFDVADNLGPHTVMLEVCNEKGACTQSATKTVQTWGPFAPGNIHSIAPTIDVTRISWTIEVDSNGSDAVVTVTSDRGRSEQFPVPIGVSSFTTQPMELGYRQTETVTVTLSDSAPTRAPVSQNASGTTAEPPPPSVAVGIGAKCNDVPGSLVQPCNPNGNSLDNCGDPSCAFIVVSLAGWIDAPDCHFEATFDVVHGGRNLTDMPNGVVETDAYYGRPNEQIRALCVSTDGLFASPWIVWN
jgi:hypothetical protein